MSRTSAALAPAAKRMSVADRIVDEYGPDCLLVAEAPDIFGGSTIIGARDHSRNGRNFVVSGTAPTLNSADTDFGGRPSLSFSGGHLATTATFSDGDFTTIIVFRDASVTGTYEVLFDYNYANNGWWGRDNADANEWTAGIIEPAGPYGQIVTATDNVRPHVGVLRRSVTTHTVWVDGAQAASKAGSGTATTAATLKVGGGASGGNYGGKIALCSRWASALSDAQLVSITSILRAWYGTAG